MSRAIEVSNHAEGARAANTDALATQIGDLMTKRNSPIAAADDFLKQVQKHSGPGEAEFIYNLENDINRKYSQNILPDLLLTSEKIGQPGHDTNSEIALANSTLPILNGNDNFRQGNSSGGPSGADFMTLHDQAEQRLLGGGFGFDDSQVNPIWSDRNAISSSDQLPSRDYQVNPISPDRNAINSLDQSPSRDFQVNPISPDRNAINSPDQSPSRDFQANSNSRNRNAIESNDPFTTSENFLFDNPAVRDWLVRSCHTRAITKDALENLVKQKPQGLEPGQEETYRKIGIIVQNWNNPEFQQIQSKFPGSSNRYLDFTKVMDFEAIHNIYNNGNAGL